MADELTKTKPKKLSPKRELFCRLYATDVDCFANGVQAYAKAYELDLSRRGAYATAKSNAYRLLTNADINARIDELLDTYINDKVADRELGFLALQRVDFSAKIAAIREYNRLKGRVAVPGSGNINIIALILKQWGLDNVGEEDSGAAGAVPDDTTRA